MDIIGIIERKILYTKQLTLEEVILLLMILRKLETLGLIKFNVEVKEK
jgi:hypothetical protein